MFAIKSVELTNFGSFRGTHTWVLPEAPGLYLLTGTNELNPRLGKNDVGKSTLLNAIRWCFYGVDTRGLKASHVITYGEDNCSVTVRGIVRNEPYEITRTQGHPNSLVVNGVTSDLCAVTSLFTLAPEAYNYSIHQPQTGKTFLDLSPADKLTLFSDIMRLESWLERSQAATSVVKRLESASDRTEQSLGFAENKRVELGNNLHNLKAKEKGFAAEQHEALLDYQTQLAEEKSRKALRLEEIHGIKRIRLQIARQLKKLHKEITTNDKWLAKLDKLERPLIDKISDLRGELASLQSKMDKVGSVDERCPVCQQEVSKQHKALTASYIKHSMKPLNTKLQEEEAEQKRLRELLGKAGEKRVELNREMLSLNKDDVVAVNQIRLINGSIDSIEAKIDDLESDIEHEKKRKNPYSELIAVTENDINVTEKMLVTLKSQQEKLQVDLKANEFWISGFKRLRLHLVEETLRSLEVEINSNLASLGLTEWEVKFDIERENKSGGVTKGFTVAISSPTHKEMVPWASWGGGVAQLLRTAATMGLSNLILERAGLNTSVEFWDEPSQHLSTEALMSLCETLQSHAHDTHRTVILVDHNATDYPFDGFVRVVKGSDGFSSLESPDAAQ